LITASAALFKWGPTRTLPQQMRPAEAGVALVLDIAQTAEPLARGVDASLRSAQGVFVR
jgi:hypothetical protein